MKGIDLMENLSSDRITCKLKALCRSISDVRIKHDYDLTLSVYDKKSPESTECSQNIKGSADHSLLKLIAVIGIVSVAASAICWICSLFRD